MFANKPAQIKKCLLSAGSDPRQLIRYRFHTRKTCPKFSLTAGCWTDWDVLDVCWYHCVININVINIR